MNLLIINGPNLNLVGKREPEIYGNVDINSFIKKLSQYNPNVTIDHVQSNHEGEIIDILHKSGFGKYDGIIINPGGFSHYSVAIADAVAAIDTPVIEVHISNIFSREHFRHISVTGAKCTGVISGLGLDGYRLAVEAFLKTFLKTEP